MQEGTIFHRKVEVNFTENPAPMIRWTPIKDQENPMMCARCHGKLIAHESKDCTGTLLACEKCDHRSYL